MHGRGTILSEGYVLTRCIMLHPRDFGGIIEAKRNAPSGAAKARCCGRAAQAYPLIIGRACSRLTLPHQGPKTYGPPSNGDLRKVGPNYAQPGLDTGRVVYPLG